MTAQIQAAGWASVPELGAALAFDFGEKRIGVAVGDLKLRIAHPLTTIAAEANEPRFAAIAQLIAEYRPALLVVGLPLNPDRPGHPAERLARKFAQRLSGRFSLPTVLVDERLTSFAAAEALAEAGVRGARQKLWKDRVAAQKILEQFFSDPRAVVQ